MRRAAAIVFSLSAIAAAPAARAQMIPPEPPPEKSPAGPDSDDWCGQVILADLAGLGSSIALFGLTRSAAAVIPYLLAAPAVHAVHGDDTGTALSLLLNAVVPVAFGYLGYRLMSLDCAPNTGDPEACGDTGAALGAIVGFFVAVGLDAGLVSHPGRPAAPAAPSPKVDVSPSLGLGPGGRYALGLSGRF